MNKQDAINKEIKKLKKAKTNGWHTLERQILQKRLKWFEDNRDDILSRLEGSDLEKAYRLLLLKLGIDEDGAPVVEKTGKKIMFHSKNFCPTLEACKILGFDTGEVCRAITEKPTEELIKKINPRLRFERNYDKLRPCCDYCEEWVRLDG